MSLKDRLQGSDAHSPSNGLTAMRPGNGQRIRTSQSAGEAIRTVRERAQEALFARLGARLYDPSLTEEQLHAMVTVELEWLFENGEMPLSETERQQLVESVTQDVMGYGPIEPLLANPEITEIMVNGNEDIFVERAGRLESTNARFVSDEHVRRVIDRIVSAVGRRIDESSPMVDARLPDGSRINAVVPPLAVDGPSLTIRKFSKRPFSVDDLIGFGTLTPRISEFIQACVEAKVSIVVSGGTGSGKTTLLNVVSDFIPDDERLVSIEDSVELRLKQHNIVRLESRPANIEGEGEVTIRHLVRNALRMRPDRIIVGEVRGGEALDMLQAMNTGHEGSLTTLHANSPRDALSRMETMVLMAGMDLPLLAIREQVASAVELLIHTTRLADGSRRVINITDVSGMEGEVIQLNDIFGFDFGAGRDEHGHYLGSIHPTGLRPSFSEKLSNAGIDLPIEMFGADAGPRRSA